MSIIFLNILPKLDHSIFSDTDLFFTYYFEMNKEKRLAVSDMKMYGIPSSYQYESIYNTYMNWYIE
jgi:hypothetical protein